MKSWSWTTFEQRSVFWIVCHTPHSKNHAIKKYQGRILPPFLRWQERVWQVAFNKLRLVVLTCSLCCLQEFEWFPTNLKQNWTFSGLASLDRLALFMIWTFYNTAWSLQDCQRKLLRFGLNVVENLQEFPFIYLFVYLLSLIMSQSLRAIFFSPPTLFVDTVFPWLFVITYHVPTTQSHDKQVSLSKKRDW